MERSPLWVDSARLDILCGTGDFGIPDDDLRRTMTELAKNGMPLHMRELGDFRVPATATPWEKLPRRAHPNFREILPFKTDYVLSFEFKVPEDASDDMHNCDFLGDELVKTTQDVMLAWNLAQPGCVKLRTIHVTTEPMDMLSREQHSPSSLLVARDASTREGWPTIETLPFDLVWTWLRSQEWLTDGVSTSATSRAICAFSHLLRSDEPAIQLFWALVGLESFYTEGEGGLLAQMRSRAPLVLGAGPRAHKLIGEMYQVRSKFVHGKLDFASAHRVVHPRASEFKASRDLSDAVSTAIGMLVGSIQQLIRHNWPVFRFEVALLSP